MEDYEENNNHMPFEDYRRLSGISEDRIKDFKWDLGHKEAIYRYEDGEYVNHELYEKSILDEIEEMWVQVGKSETLIESIHLYGLTHRRLTDMLNAIRATWKEFSQSRDYDYSIFMQERIRLVASYAYEISNTYLKTIDILTSHDPYKPDSEDKAGS